MRICQPPENSSHVRSRSDVGRASPPPPPLSARVGGVAAVPGAMPPPPPLRPYHALMLEGEPQALPRELTLSSPLT